MYTTSQIIHSYIYKNQINFSIKIIENYPCKSNDELKEYENKLITSYNPPYNIKKHLDLKICVDCNSKIYTGNICRICKTVQKQVLQKKYIRLNPSKIGCYDCGRAGERFDGFCRHCFFIENGQNSRFDYLEMMCMYAIVYINNEYHNDHTYTLYTGNKTPYCTDINCESCSYNSR